MPVGHESGNYYSAEAHDRQSSSLGVCLSNPRLTIIQSYMISPFHLFQSCSIYYSDRLLEPSLVIAELARLCHISAKMQSNARTECSCDFGRRAGLYVESHPATCFRSPKDWCPTESCKLLIAQKVNSHRFPQFYSEFSGVFHQSIIFVR